MSGHLIHNEKTKLTGTWLNTLAGGSILVGVITPTAAVIYGTVRPGVGMSVAALASLVFIVFGIGLHLLARAVLEGLKE
ncbi:hypothetical protein [Roseomonas elaeocarpi]|uniref:Amino acid transporter n=1 Tax=Roseomonas elaeocarpi TaxID=907779 RepID=A0ABV6JR88_9PROT